MSDKEHGQKEPKAIEGQAHLEIRATLKATGEVIRQPEEPLFRKGVYLALNKQLGDVERGQAAGLLPGSKRLRARRRSERHTC
jgi:hypothetical protein